MACEEGSAPLSIIQASGSPSKPGVVLYFTLWSYPKRLTHYFTLVGRQQELIKKNWSIFVMLIGARLRHQSIFDLFQCAALMGLKIPVWSKILKKHASNVKMGAWGLVRWEGRKSSGCPTNNIWDGISKNNNWEYTNRYQGDKQKQWAWVSFELNRWISREVLGNDG